MVNSELDKRGKGNDENALHRFLKGRARCSQIANGMSREVYTNASESHLSLLFLLHGDLLVVDLVISTSFLVLHVFRNEILQVGLGFGL